MIKYLQIRRALSLFVCCLLLLSLPGMCSAEQTYQIQDQELTQLDNNLTLLSINNQNLLIQLKQSKQDLGIASSQLEQLKAQLITLQLQTQTALQQQQTAQALLQTANVSLSQYEKETKSKIRKVTLERDIAIIGIIAMLFRK